MIENKNWEKNSKLDIVWKKYFNNYPCYSITSYYSFVNRVNKSLDHHCFKCGNYIESQYKILFRITVLRFIIEVAIMTGFIFLTPFSIVFTAFPAVPVTVSTTITIDCVEAV